MFDFEKQDIVADSYTFHKTKGSSGTARSMASGEGLFYKVKKGDTLGRMQHVREPPSTSFAN